MNSEQVKVEKFFNRLWDKTVSKAVSWFLVGLFMFFIILLCMMPVQEIFADTEDAPLLIPGVLTMFTFLMVSFRVGPYDQYADNQKSRFMTDILKYHPVSRKEIWKQKISTLMLFLSKVTGAGMVMQIVGVLISQESISWLNFFYIIFFVFVLPVVGIVTFDLIAKKVGE